MDTNRSNVMTWKLLIGLGALGLGMIAVGMMVAAAAPHRITRDGFQAIETGMTEREVEAILRRPPGDYTRPGACLCGEHFARVLVPEELRKRWESNELVIDVYFRDGRVVSSDCGNGAIRLYPDRTLLERIRDMSGL
jgi:hypothetical protein